MSDSSTRGGRRPGAGRKPGHGTGPNPEIRERVPADLADYCKAQQATSPGFLARLIRQHKEHFTMPILKSKRANNIPGDTELKLTSQAADNTGKVWPAGTVYQPSSAGFCNIDGVEYQDVRIKGQTVRFVR